MSSTTDRPAPPGDYVAQLMSVLAADPDRTAAHWRATTRTAGELHREITRLALAMRRLGIGVGSTVSVLTAPNSPVMLTARYAAHLLGAAVCYLRSANPGSTAPLLSVEAQSDLLLDSSSRLLVTDADQDARADALLARTPGAFAVLKVPEGLPDAAPEAADAVGPTAPEALAAILYTSGSTGRPKGICLTRRAWDGIVRTAMTGIAPDEQARILITTPLSHTVATMADAVLVSGGTVFLHEGFDAAQVVRAVEEHRITRTFMAVPHLYRLLDHHTPRSADLSSLRQLVYSGCAAAPARLAQAVRVFGPVLIQGYGTTEGGRVTLLDPGEHFEPELLTTVGRPFPEVSVKVCDDEGAELGAGGVGEVYMSSPHLMSGYWRDPVRTAQVLGDGWYRTGDVGYLDRRGYLHLLDRVADVVKTGGVKVYPAEVEKAVAALPGIAQIAVYGIRDADDLEHLHAAIVPHPGARVTDEEVRARIAREFSAAHVPERIVRLAELPLNATGKPDRRRLRSLSAAGAPAEPLRARGTARSRE